MQRKMTEHSLFMQQIDHLKRSTCPQRYRYTHEFLDLAMTAARREAPCAIQPDEGNEEDDAGTLAGTILVH